MSNQNNGKVKNGKGIVNIIIIVVIGAILITGYFKVSEILEKRKIETKILENNSQVYNNSQQNTQSTEIINGEPTDLPPYQNNNNTNSGLSTQQPSINNTTDQSIANDNVANSSTWNGKTLIGLEKAKQIAIDTVGGGDIIHYEEDTYDLDDAPTYNFEIRKGDKVYEVEIDALNGSVKDYDMD